MPLTLSRSLWRAVRGMLRFELGAEGSGADHVGGAGIGVLAIDDQANQARVGVGDAFDRGVNAQTLGAAVEDGRAEAFGAAALGQEQGPGGRFDGVEILAEGLIGLEGGVRADEEDVELFVHATLSLTYRGRGSRRYCVLRVACSARASGFWSELWSQPFPAFDAESNVARPNSVHELFAAHVWLAGAGVAYEALDRCFPLGAIFRLAGVALPKRVEQALRFRAHQGSRPAECDPIRPGSSVARATCAACPGERPAWRRRSRRARDRGNRVLPCPGKGSGRRPGIAQGLPYDRPAARGRDCPANGHPPIWSNP